MTLPEFGFASTAEEVADALEQEISGKNVLITGTSMNGIGFETARAIAKHASLVVVTGYNLERLKLSEDAIKKSIPTANIRKLVIDLSSLAAVRKAAAEVNAYPEPLHVLIHNAHPGGSGPNFTSDGLEVQMAAAHVGPFLLTKLLAPKLLSSATSDFVPRVVWVSSQMHAYGPPLDVASVRTPDTDPSKYNTLAWYQQSKVAGLLTAGELSRRAAGRLRVYTLHPGVIFTKAMQTAEAVPTLQAYGTLDAQGQPIPDKHPWKTIPQGAATTVVAAFDPRLKDKSGVYLDDCKVSNAAPIATDSATAAQLWSVTEEIIGEKFEL